MFIGYKEKSFLWCTENWAFLETKTGWKSKIDEKHLVKVSKVELKKNICPTVQALTLWHGRMKRGEPTSGVISHSIMVA